MLKKKIANAKAKGKQKQKLQQKQHAKALAESLALDPQPNLDSRVGPRTISSCFDPEVIEVKTPTTRGDSEEFENYFSKVQAMGQFPARNSAPDLISTSDVKQDERLNSKEGINPDTKTAESGCFMKFLSTDEGDDYNASMKSGCFPKLKGAACHCETFDDELSSNPSVFSQNGSRSASGTSTFSNSMGLGPVPEPSDSYPLRSLPITTGSSVTELEKEQEIAYALYLQRQKSSQLKEQSLKARQENQKFRDKKPVPSSETVVVNGFTFNSWSEAVDDLNDQLDTFVESSSRFENEKNEAGMRVKLLDLELAKSKELARKLEKKIKNIEIQRIGQEKKLRDLKGELEISAGRRSLVESLEGKLVTSESHKASLEYKLQAAVAKSATFQDQVQNIEVKLGNVTAELTKATDSVVELQQEVRLVENERMSLEVQLRKATTARILPIEDLPRVRTKDPETLKEITDLKQQIQKLERKFGNREQEIRILEQDIETADAQHAEMQQEIQVRDETIILLEDQLQSVESYCIKLQQECKSLDLNVEPLQAQVQSLQGQQKFGDPGEQVRRLEEQLKAVEDQRDDLNWWLVNQAGKLEALEIQLRKVEDQRDNGIEASKNKDNTIQHLERQVHLAEGERMGYFKELQDQAEEHKIHISRLAKKQEQQWAENARLRRQLENLDGERQSQALELRFLKGEIEDANLRCSDLEHYLAQLKTFGTAIKNRETLNPQAVEADSMSLSTLQPVTRQLQQVHRGPNNQHQSCEDIIKHLQNKLTSMIEKDQDLTAKSTMVKQNQFKTAIHQTVLIQELQDKISKLKIERDKTSPLFKCAVDVRLGFLEHARAVTNEKGGEPHNESREVRINAKIASHCANGQLDAAIITSGLVPVACLGASEQIFEELYSIPPAQYCSWVPKSARLVDCQATLKAIPPSESLGLTAADTKEYYKTVQDLMILRGEVGDEEFEQSEEAEWLVQRLEYLTGMIVAMRV